MLSAISLLVLVGTLVLIRHIRPVSHKASSFGRGTCKWAGLRQRVDPMRPLLLVAAVPTRNAPTLSVRHALTVEGSTRHAESYSSVMTCLGIGVSPPITL